MTGMSPAAVAWTKLTREERQAILAQRWADAKAKNEAKKKKEADDKFMREHPNALVRVITQEEADQRNAAMARRPKAWHELDAKLGIVRTPKVPGLVRPPEPAPPIVNRAITDGPPYIRAHTGVERADENLTVGAIFGGSITSGGSLGVWAGSVVPGVGNVVGGILGVCGGAIVGMAASYAYCKNEENRRRS